MTAPEAFWHVVKPTRALIARRVWVTLGEHPKPGSEVCAMLLRTAPDSTTADEVLARGTAVIEEGSRTVDIVLDRDVELLPWRRDVVCWIQPLDVMDHQGPDWPIVAVAPRETE